MTELGEMTGAVKAAPHLSLSAVAEVVRTAGSSDCSDAEVIDRLSLLEELISACGAAQIKLTHRLHVRRTEAVRDRLHRAPVSAIDDAVNRSTRSVARETGLARRESASSGRALLTVADTVSRWLPRTLAALDDGRTNAYRVRLVADAARKLPEDARDEFDRLIAPQLDGAANGQVERRAAALVYRLDPHGALTRIRRSLGERGVSTRPVGDGLVRLSITAPLVGGVAGFASLRKDADTRRLTGDPRTLDQIMSDEAISRLTGGVITGCDADGMPVRVPSDQSSQAGVPDPVAELNRRRRAQDPSSGGAVDGETTRAATHEGSADDSRGRSSRTHRPGLTKEVENVGTPTHGVGAGPSQIVPDPDVQPRAAGFGFGLPDGEGCASDFVDDATLFDWLDRWERLHGGAESYPDDGPELHPDESDWPIEAFDEAAFFAWMDDPANAHLCADPISPIGRASGPSSGLRIHLHLILSDRTLLGTTEDPAVLLGLGPVPAHTARRLATLLDDLARTTVRRYLTDPVNGRLSECDPRVREFPDVVKEFLATRDQECRGPCCGAPIRHNDHIVAVADGGPTNKDNGQGLCENCNQVKECSGWSTSVDPVSGTISTRTPTGHVYRSHEPPVVGARDLGEGSSAEPLRNVGVRPPS